MKVFRKFYVIVYNCIYLFFLAGAVPACASSLLYAFSSGDILLTNPSQTPTYGIGRMDFDPDTGEPVPTILYQTARTWRIYTR